MNNAKTEHPVKGTILTDLTPMLSIIGRYEVADGKGGVEGELSNLCVNRQPDGVEITGNGTLQHPMNVKLSPVYQAAPAGLLLSMNLYLKMLQTPSESWRAFNQDVYVDLREFISSATGCTAKFTQELFEELAMEVKYHGMTVNAAVAKAQQAIDNFK